MTEAGTGMTQLQAKSIRACWQCGDPEETEMSLHSPANTFLSHFRPQNHEMIDFCCFKSPDL
jgi:hypothetical protein